jgi:hypothetical protein
VFLIVFYFFLRGVADSLALILFSIASVFARSVAFVSAIMGYGSFVPISEAFPEIEAGLWVPWLPHPTALGRAEVRRRLRVLEREMGQLPRVRVVEPPPRPAVDDDVWLVNVPAVGVGRGRGHGFVADDAAIVPREVGRRWRGVFVPDVGPRGRGAALLELVRRERALGRPQDGRPQDGRPQDAADERD